MSKNLNQQSCIIRIACTESRADAGTKMKLASLFCISNLIIALLASSMLAQERSLSKQIEPSLVTVISYDESGKVLQQSGGFFVNESGDILTSFRILKAANRIEIKSSAGQLLQVKKIVAANEEKNLLRLSLNISGIAVKPIKISSRMPKIGERVAIINQAKEVTISEGNVSVIHKSSGHDRAIEIKADVTSSINGNPIVNMKGELVGSATPQTEDGRTKTFAMLSTAVMKPDVSVIWGAAPDSNADKSVEVAAPGVNRVSGRFGQGEAIKRVGPAFPPLAKAARIGGDVVVEVTVDEEGNVITARAVSGHPLLIDASVSAAREWKFAPTRMAGIPIKVIGTITFNFNK